MSSRPPLPKVAGRRMGLFLLVSVQWLIGVIHVFFGFWLLSVSLAEFVYSLYTVVFGVCSLLFALGLWMWKTWGWFGTISILLFVIAVDAMTLVGLPSIPGIPKFAAFGEIAYSVILLLYLFRQKNLKGT